MSISALMPTYARADVTFEKGEGLHVWDSAGRRYLDFGAGIAVLALGHSHPHLVKAIQEQAGRLMHTSNLFRIAGQERLAERLVESTFADSVFFTNSGAEANECLIKCFRRYQHMNGHPERWRAITFEGAFHGRTLATIAAAGQEKLLNGFGPKVDGFDIVPLGDLEAVEAAVTEETAAIYVEPVQGEGGVRNLPEGTLKGLRAIADRHGLLLVLDEVQSGMGRTGRLLAHEWMDATPDVAALGKGIGGGFPMGACIATEKVAQAMTAGTHGSTYGGNPLAMAAGNAVLDVMLADGFLDNVTAMGRRLKAGLESLRARNDSVVEDVRGMGLMAGFRARGTNTDVVARLREKGLLTIPAGDNVVRLLPPLIAEAGHVDEALSIIDGVGRDSSG